MPIFNAHNSSFEYSFHCYILAEDGKTPAPEPDLLKWEIWYETANRQVAHTVIDIGEEVSTVFTGIDSGYRPGEPCLFKTMVFGGVNDSFRAIYRTWQQAEAGHKEVVHLVLKGNPIA